MYFQLTKEEVKFLKRQLPTIRLNGYDIEKFQSIMKSLDKPVKAIPEHLTTFEPKQEGSNSRKHVTQEEFYGGVKQEEREVLVDNPIEYENTDILERNSFLKPPKIERTIKKEPPTSNYTEQLEQLEQINKHNEERLAHLERLDKSNTQSTSIHQEEDIVELKDELPVENSIEEDIQDSIQTEENLPIEEENPIQTEPEDSIFRNQTTDVDSASIFSIVDSRTKKE